MNEGRKRIQGVTDRFFFDHLFRHPFACAPSGSALPEEHLISASFACGWKPQPLSDELGASFSEIPIRWIRLIRGAFALSHGGSAAHDNKVVTPYCG